MFPMFQNAILSLYFFLLIMIVVVLAIIIVLTFPVLPWQYIH